MHFGFSWKWASPVRRGKIDRQKPAQLPFLFFRAVFSRLTLLAMSSKKLAQKCKQFIWTWKNIGDLLTCLKAFTTKKEFQGLPFDETRGCTISAQCRALRKEIANI